MAVLVDVALIRKKRAEYIQSGLAQSYDDMVAVGKWLDEAEAEATASEQKEGGGSMR